MKPLTLGVAAAILFLFAGATAATAEEPSNSVQQRSVHDALQYWKGEDGLQAFKQLREATIVWNVTGVCDGYAGCAYVGGCTTLPSNYCTLWVYGDGYMRWGYDWLVGVLKHEMGHLLGYNHGDPTCTMNPDYC